MGVIISREEAVSGAVGCGAVVRRMLPLVKDLPAKLWLKFRRKTKFISFPSLQSFLTCMGRFPFSKKKSKVEEEEDVLVTHWVFHLCSPASFPFHVSSCLVLTWLVVMIIGYTSLWINASPQQTETKALSLNCSVVDRVPA